jgi:hypothetical protein
MAKRTLTIPAIFSGASPSQYFSQDDQFNSSIAVDPDYPISSSDVKASGFAVPIGYTDFSGSNVNSAPIAIINTPKNTNTYVVLKNGRLISYNSSLASESLIGTVSGNVANGAWYYNNYIYITTGTNVSRYGPLDNSPSLTDSVWTGATLGSLTALTNTTYPTIRGVALPNHWGFAHSDGSSYFLDFKNGQGMVHRINTKKGTDEGDTNGTTVPSAYNVLDLPFGFYPTAICDGPNGTDIAILGIKTTDSTIDQGKPGLFLWDPTNVDSFYAGPIHQADALATAMLNDNGILKVWSGNASSGVRVSKYLGGQTFSEIVYQDEGTPPFPGAVDARGSRLVWGGWTTYPAASACVWAYGSKNDSLPKGIHNIIKATSSGATPNVTACKFVLQSNNKQPQMVVGWRDDSGDGIDKYSSSATLTSQLRWMFNIGTQFDVLKIRIPFGGAVAANTGIQPTLYIDDASSSKALTQITNTNFSAKRKVVYKTPELVGAKGENNLMFDLLWSDTNPLSVAFPITIEINEHTDEL